MTVIHYNTVRHSLTHAVICGRARSNPAAYSLAGDSTPAPRHAGESTVLSLVTALRACLVGTDSHPFLRSRRVTLTPLRVLPWILHPLTIHFLHLYYIRNVKPSLSFHNTSARACSSIIIFQCTRHARTRNKKIILADKIDNRNGIN